MPEPELEDEPELLPPLEVPVPVDPVGTWTGAVGAGVGAVGAGAGVLETGAGGTTVDELDPDPPAPAPDPAEGVTDGAEATALEVVCVTGAAATTRAVTTAAAWCAGARRRAWTWRTAGSFSELDAATSCGATTVTVGSTTLAAGRAATARPACVADTSRAPKATAKASNNRPSPSRGSRLLGAPLACL